MGNFDPNIDLRPSVFILGDPVGALDQVFISWKTDERDADGLSIAICE
jgi:hypothetical protein